MKLRIIFALLAFLSLLTRVNAQESCVGCGVQSGGAVAGGPVAFTTPLLMLGSLATSALPTAATSYNHLVGTTGGSSWNASIQNRYFPIPIAGKFSGLQVYGGALALTAGTEVFSLAGTDGTVTCTIGVGGPPESCHDDTHLTAAITAGTNVAVQVVGAGVTGVATSAIQVSAAFTGSNVNEGMVLASSSSNLSATAVNFGGIMIGSATESLSSFVMPTAGTLDSLYAVTTGATAAGTGYDFIVFKNGQATNIDAYCNASISCNDTAGCSPGVACTHNVPVVAGDTISIASCPTATTALTYTNGAYTLTCPHTGTAPAARQFQFGLRWLPTVNKQAVVLAVPTTLPQTNSGATRYSLTNGSGGSDVANTNDLNLLPYTPTNQVYGNLTIGYCWASGVVSTFRNVTLELTTPTTMLTTGAFGTNAPSTCPAAGTAYSAGSNTLQLAGGSYTVTGPIPDTTLIDTRIVNTLSPPAFSQYKQSMTVVVQ